MNRLLKRGPELVSAASAVPRRGQNPTNAVKPRVPPEWNSTSPSGSGRRFHTRHSRSAERGFTSRGRWTSRSAAASPGVGAPPGSRWSVR